MAAEFPRLTEPFELGGHRLANRIVLTAHGEHLAVDGLVTERLIAHHERRAAAGTGLIVCGGSAAVSPSASNPALISLWDPRNDGPLASLAERLHAHGTTVLCQATHRATRELPGGLDAHHVAPSPSAAVPPYGAPAVLTRDDIDELVGQYVTAARRLARAGFDGVGVSALGTHLIEQFWSPVLNRRDDEYGGSLRNRLRFGVRVVEAIADGVPGGFLVAFRMSADLHSAAVGLDTEDLLEIAAAMGELGRIDLFDIAGGSGMSVRAHTAAVPTDDFPVKCNNEAAAVRAVVSAPVLVAGRILTPREGEETLAEGAADLVGMTRALIADPDLPEHVRAGRAERIRPCIAINEGCRRVVVHKTLACTVNPEVGAPALDAGPAAAPRRVVVVGGGPAGMEAARVAAVRGHDVVLLERDERLGGQVGLAARLPGRPHLADHVAWLERELGLAGVSVRLGTEATPGVLLAERPDAVVVATGSRTVVPPDFARSLGTAVTDVDVLAGRAEVPAGSRVLVYDAEGHIRGAALACLLSARDVAVDYVTPFPAVAHHLEPPNKSAVMRGLRRSTVRPRCDTLLVGAGRDKAVLRDVWTEDESPVPAGYDLCVIAGFRVAAAELRANLPAGAGDVTVVGDAKAPRLLRNAISEGARAAAAL